MACIRLPATVGRCDVVFFLSYLFSFLFHSEDEAFKSIEERQAVSTLSCRLTLRTNTHRSWLREFNRFRTLLSSNQESRVRSHLLRILGKLMAFAIWITPISHLPMIYCLTELEQSG